MQPWEARCANAALLTEMLGPHQFCELLQRRKARDMQKETSLRSLWKEPKDFQRSCHSSFEPVTDHGPGSRQLSSPGKEGGKPRKEETTMGRLD